MNIPKYFTRLLPLSITAYGVLYILLGLLTFGGLGWLTIKDILILKIETKQRYIELAKNELTQTVAHIFSESEKLAKLFSNWDETIQQLSDSTYYSYWREFRAPSASFVPKYFLAVELYNRNGISLAPPSDQDMPTQISLPISSIQIVKQNNRDNLFYSYPVAYDFKSKHVGGYIVLKIDFISALSDMQKFKFVDLNSISIEAQENEVITEKNLIKYINIDIVPNEEFNKLQNLMFNTLKQFAFVGISLASILLYLFVKIFGLPSRRLSLQIDVLRRGDHQSMQNSNKHKLAVAEFEKIRISLNDYQTQLDYRDAALRENEMRMRAVLDNVVDGIITIDEHGVIESSNPAVQRIFGFSDKDLTGNNITVLFTEASRHAYYAYCGKCFQFQMSSKNTNDVCELTGTRLNHSEFPIEIALSKMQLAGIRLYIVMVRDITERKRAEERLVYLANYDELTGLPNRTLFRDRLHQAVAHAKREDRLVAVIFFDLDHFKKINDTLGHHAGDQLLLGASKRLKDSVRDLDTVARLGGDEFMVILEGIHNVDEVTDIVTKLLHGLEKPFDLNGQEAFVAASAGIALYPFDDIDIDNLVKNADTAMFRAKEHGGNTYQYFKADMNTQAVERLKLESALRHAMERNEFELYYQPRVDLKAGHICGMEALLRWHSPEFGPVPPARFIPLLEESGLIISVGEWVLKTACEQTQMWNDIGYTLRVAVNLSVRQFRQKDLVKRFTSIWESLNFDPRNLELEITESLLVENIDAAVSILQLFHADGVHISIDDFGTGYSSLSYLKRFPINTLKIDRSFVRDIIEDPDDAAITAAIVALARSLRLNVTAEGIETKQQLEYIRALHCDEAQGFYFSKPLPAKEFAACLRQQQFFGIQGQPIQIRVPCLSST